MPFIAYGGAISGGSDYRYKDFLFRNASSDDLLLISVGVIIAYIIYHCLGDIFTEIGNYLGTTLYNIIIKLNSVSYIPVILTTLTVIFIGFAIYKTKKYLKEK